VDASRSERQHDVLDLVLRIERALGFELTEPEKEQIPSPDFNRRLSIEKFIWAVCAVAVSRPTSSRSQTESSS